MAEQWLKLSPLSEGVVGLPPGSFWVQFALFPCVLVGFL